MTKEQGEALLAYIAAFAEETEVTHLVSRHSEDAASIHTSNERRKAALEAFRALLP